MSVDMCHWWVVFSKNMSNHALSNQEQAIPILGQKTSHSAMSKNQKVISVVMAIPGNFSETVALKEERQVSRWSSVLPFIRSLETQPHPQEEHCLRPLAMVRTPSTRLTYES